MKITVITLFPQFIEALLEYSILKRAAQQGVLSLEAVDLRDFGLGKRRQVDDTPYGGGAGMVLRADVLDAAIKNVRENNPDTRVIMLTPKGRTFTQAKAKELATAESIALVCGHYEGFDERVRGMVDEELSIGDFILSGGETPAMVIIDAVMRLLPGALGNETSPHEESFEDSLLEYPHYTKPYEYNGQKVPDILLSGNHAQIEEWRSDQAGKLTKERRPDLQD